MAKLSTKKINIADYSKDNQADVAKLARSLNPLMDDLERLFRGGISVDDNLPFQYITFTVEVDGSNDPKTSIKITTSLTTTIKGCIPINANSDSNFPNGALGVVCIPNGNQIEIKKVFGIPANTKFNVTIMVVS